MTYQIEFEARAAKDLRGIPPKERDQIGRGIEAMKRDLRGDVIKLKGEDGKYRLRVGRYRVLFKLEGNRVVIYRIRVRGSSYSQFVW